jgi:hypothetical protein
MLSKERNGDDLAIWKADGFECAELDNVFEAQLLRHQLQRGIGI